jgi:hypothetical protein
VLKFNEATISSALQHVDEFTDNYFCSSEYSKQWSLYGTLKDSYFMRKNPNMPAWKSNLYLGAFYINVETLKIQFANILQNDPFVNITPKDNYKKDAIALEKASIAHADLNYDLHISNFNDRLRDCFFFDSLIGYSCGREYIKVDTRTKKTARVSTDPYGSQIVQEGQYSERIETTCTDIIHPLNFAHDITKGDFVESQENAVRFELPVSEIYKMLKDTRYNQPGVKETLEFLEKSTYVYSVGQNTFYSDNGGEKTSTSNTRNKVVCYEYTGTLRYKGNERDNTIYQVLWVKDTKQVLQIRKSPFGEIIPYWKRIVKPVPCTPYGIPPNYPAFILNQVENHFYNANIDYTNAAMKWNYEIKPENINGGLAAYYNALPGGGIPIREDVPLGSTMRRIDGEMTSIPSFNTMMQILDGSKQEYAFSKLIRGTQTGNQTATEASLINEKEDILVASMIQQTDVGLKNCMFIKLHALANNFQNERKANIDGVDVLHYPRELADQDYSIDIKREKSDIQSAKNFAFLQKLQSVYAYMDQRQTPMNPEPLIDLIEAVGIAGGVPETVELVKKMRDSLPKPAEIGAPQTPGMPDAQPGAPQESPEAMAMMMAQQQGAQSVPQAA